ncbi:MAG: hypothetical protein KA157_13990 [Aliarcobacter sp.]|nr:hypothetical protein [Aliarcobacter sp.]
MKNKIVLFLLVVVASINIYAEGFSVKGGLQINQSLEEEFLGDSDSFDIDSGYNLGLSYDFKVSKGWDIGLGMDILSKSLENNGFDSGIEVNPIYAQLKYNFKRTEKNNPYTIIKLGYPVISGNSAEDLTGVSYGAFGGGVEMGKFLIELLFDSSIFDEDFYYYSGSYAGVGSLTISRVNLSFGYNFGRGNSYTNKNETYINNKDKKIEDRINELNSLRKSGTISEEEYQESRKNILNSL